MEDYFEDRDYTDIDDQLMHVRSTWTTTQNFTNYDHLFCIGQWEVVWTSREPGSEWANDTRDGKLVLCVRERERERGGRETEGAIQIYFTHTCTWG
jgi:hypothetical protein